MLTAGTRFVRSLPTAEGPVDFYRDRLVLRFNAGDEIMYERVTGHRAKVFTLSPAAIVTYRMPLGGGLSVKRSNEFRFDGADHRDAFLQEVSAARERYADMLVV
jgi:hypothetical protein